MCSNAGVELLLEACALVGRSSRRCGRTSPHGQRAPEKHSMTGNLRRSPLGDMPRYKLQEYSRIRNGLIFKTLEFSFLSPELALALLLHKHTAKDI